LTRSGPASTPDHRVRDFIEKYQPEHLFCGHFHEAEGAAFQNGNARPQRNVGKAGFLN
jgi:hypothetical protein